MPDNRPHLKWDGLVQAEWDTSADGVQELDIPPLEAPPNLEARDEELRNRIASNRAAALARRQQRIDREQRRAALSALLDEEDAPPGFSQDHDL